MKFVVIFCLFTFAISFEVESREAINLVSSETKTEVDKNEATAKNQNKNSNPEISPLEAITGLKDIINILFFLAVGTVGILTYLQARKTIFTPIKTETFKLQLKYFEEILLLFGKYEGTNIDDKFDYDKIFNMNAKVLMNDYVSTFFKDQVKIPEEAITRLQKDFYGAIISHENMSDYFELVDETTPTKPEADKNEDIKNPAIILAKWHKYNYGMIHFTKKFADETNNLNKLATFPLLPTELKEHIESFSSQVHKNLEAVGEALTEIAKDLPEKYPTPKSVMKGDLTWMWNKYNDKRVLLETHQNEILDYISKYLNIEKLLK